MADERSKYNATSAPDLIKGWNEKRLSNNDVISGLTPFVQLIGIFNNAEYEKMLSGNTTLHQKQVYYVEDNVEERVSLGSLDKDGDPIVWFQGDESHDQRDLHGSAFYAKDIEVISEGG